MSATPSPTSTNRPFIGIGVLVWKGDSLLLGQRLNSNGEGEWQFPGGHLESGETVTGCAAREVREETGIEIAGMQHAGFTDELYITPDRQYVTLYISAAYVSGEAKVLEPEKCTRWEWFQYNELPVPLFQPITNLLKQVPVLSVLQVGMDTLKDVQK